MPDCLSTRGRVELMQSGLEPLPAASEPEPQLNALHGLVLLLVFALMAACVLVIIMGAYEILGIGWGLGATAVCGVIGYSLRHR